ncbi:olfactory receptor 5A2-like [Ambystoma mexicanum]|uniref:olfactory receptor 5A2-like n=1 Tax=Ambystoma mexicanum TaxID=8296 RepID=UPI0037E9C0B9
MKNQSLVTEFLLVGLLDFPRLQMALFLLLLVIYAMSLLANIALIFAVKVNIRLHTPMYFFLLNLSALEICYISVTVPTMLSNFVERRRTISLTGCMTQIFFLHFLGCTECFLLAAMALDRFLAICHPLRYTALMDGRRCILMASASWATGCVDSTIHTVITAQLPFCGPNELKHFFCDMPPLLKLACTDTYKNDLVVRVAGGLVGLGTGLFILISYGHIIIVILSMKSSLGQRTAFSTCASHLLVVTLFYGTGIFTYLQPTTSSSLYHESTVSLCYSILTPLLNPLIYSLRNREVHGALRGAMSRHLKF